MLEEAGELFLILIIFFLYYAGGIGTVLYFTWKQKHNKKWRKNNGQSE